MHVNRIHGFFGNDPPPPEQTVPETALEERQHLLSHHVRLVCQKLTHGLFVYGSRGGLGKTKIILRVLRQERIRPVLLNGHCTPLSLYTNLYNNSDKVIFLDDCDSLYRNLPALGILRSALWGDSNRGRLVTYNSSQLEIPNSFNFTGQIIFTANNLPSKNHAFNAVLSRVDVFELDASNDDVIEMMYQLADDGFESMSPSQCRMVVHFIADNSASRELSLRILEPSYRKYLYSQQAGIDWRELVMTQLDQFGTQQPSKVDTTVDDLDCLKQVLDDHGTVKEQIEAWCQLTKKSRATFFRLKKSLSTSND
ncbi:hypothetical protein NB063_10625 [Rhodopirellula sp. ICT_H3.1]|uniref:ATPase AAA-type core domain-containing protein n=2 Tax=Aporhodopirellula aestuarii TaxID=2950107 RepID=A0ABT0U3M7_9BACT|nr:hypothetical protein [Aporhodopirellula aestuarii]